MEQLPLSLYIHFPWCVQKCPYCDFNSHNLRGKINENEYTDSLLSDLENDLEKYKQEIGNRKIKSIFLGGGTPSLFSYNSLSNLIENIRTKISFESDIEITMELNPGTSEYHPIDDLIKSPINRLSIGAQSFNDEHLQKLGRIHKSQNTINFVDNLHKSGFSNFNLDIMYGLPGQNIENVISDLKMAIELSPMHISWYQLTIEANTKFYRHPPVLPSDDEIYEYYTKGKDILKENGYVQYEISAYAKNNFQSQHNLNYWRFGDYIGIGAGSHGKITNRDHTIIRTQKISSPYKYQKSNNKNIKSKLISKDERIFEYMLFKLRLREKLSIDHFTQMTGLPGSSISAILDLATNKGLVKRISDDYQITEHGYLFLNDLINLFLLES